MKVKMQKSILWSATLYNKVEGDIKEASERLLGKMEMYKDAIGFYPVTFFDNEGKIVAIKFDIDDYIEL